jgi:hypothetical protein
MTDRQLIELGAQELAARYGFPEGKNMRQRDFEYLCARIEESSGILISLSTIKRIIFGQYNRLPQIATLNAIAVDLGYPDWQAFRAAKLSAATDASDPSAAVTDISAPASSITESAAAESIIATLPLHQPAPPPPVPPTLPAPDAPHTASHPSHRRPSYPLIGAGIVLFLLLALLSWNYFSSAPAGTASAAFGIRRTTQNTVPNTVVFTYDIDRIPGDSFFIQQSWDRHRRIRIYKGTHTLTDIYYEPGYHTAKLIANDKIIKTLPVSIPTDAWFFYSKESLSGGLPAYIHTATPIRNGILSLERQDLLASRIDPAAPQVYLYNWFPTKIGTSADNFRLVAHIRMTEVRNTACPFIMPEIFCQHGLMYFVCTMPGCTGAAGDISAKFGDHLLDGRSTDLSPLAIDVHTWHTIDMLVKEKQVSITIDGKPVLTSGYTASAGLITGLGFHSNGLAAVDSIRLTGLDGKTVYPLP